MKYTFLHAGTLSGLTLESRLQLIKQAGFSHAELDTGLVLPLMASKGLKGSVEFFQGFDLQIKAIGRISDVTFGDTASQEANLDLCHHLAELAQSIRCPYLVVTPGDLPESLPEKEILTETKAVLRELAQVALRYDVGVAFEFLGHPRSSVRHLRSALRILYMADRDNLGLVLDTFQFALGGSVLESLRKIDPRSLYLLRVSDLDELSVATDARPVPVKALPGDGRAPLGQVVEFLHEAGFERNIGIDVAPERYLETKPAQLATEAYRRLMALREEPANFYREQEVLDEVEAFD